MDDEELLTIGELARAAGLSVSALRFYHREGLIVPADVDPASGYRRYTRAQLHPAVLVASLRRVGMPLADVAAVLAARSTDPAAAHALLARQLRRLEHGLTDARRELARPHDLIDEGTPMTVTAAVTAVLPAAALAAAVDAVRFAAGTDPQLPVLTGVLLELEPGLLRLVATDRYRLAVTAAPATTSGTASAVLPAELVDRVRAAAAEGDAVVALGPDGVSVTCGDAVAEGLPLGEAYPDYRTLVPAAAAHRIPVDVATLRADLLAAPAHEQADPAHGATGPSVVLAVGPDGTLAVGGGDGDALRVGVNRDFLLEALDAAAADRLLLDVESPVLPLALRRPAGDETLSLLMPVRLTA